MGEISISNLNNRYVDFLWLLSIGILLEIDNSVLCKLFSLAQRDGLNDMLINFLISTRDPEWNVQGNSLVHPILPGICPIIYTDKASAAAALKNYLEKFWYKGHSSSGWYEAHKSKENTYAGYWSFESAAVVKLLKLDDSMFKDNAYYPYDLVHWKNNMPG